MYLCVSVQPSGHRWYVGCAEDVQKTFNDDLLESFVL